MLTVARRIAFLVRIEELEQVEADAHPLARRHVLCAAVRDAADQVDAVLLHLLVPVAQDGREPRQQVFDRRLHRLHADHVHDRLDRRQDAAQHLWVLLADVLVQHDAEVREQLLLGALLHHDRDARRMRSAACCRVRGSLWFSRHLIVPLICGRYGLARRAEAGNDGAKAVEEHVHALVLHKAQPPASVDCGLQTQLTRS